MKLRIVCISDTHGLHRQISVPDGDILIHAGDLTRRGELDKVADFDDFLGGLPHPYKIVIAGNHDFCFEREPERSAALLTNATYLLDQSVTVEGVLIYGSPWQPEFHNWAFNLPRGAALRARWERIPHDTDILITHGPPFGHGDRTVLGLATGCEDLLAVVQQIRPRLHIFGHIHEGYGMTRNEHTTFINASSCCFDREPRNPPIVVDYEVD